MSKVNFSAKDAKGIKGEVLEVFAGALGDAPCYINGAEMIFRVGSDYFSVKVSGKRVVADEIVKALN